MTPAVAILAAALFAGLDDDAGPPGRGTVRDLILLADDRPVFLRLRISEGDRPFRSAWLDSVDQIHAALDRDGDGTLSAEEADAGTIAALVRLATGGGPPDLSGLGDATGNGVVTADELAGALRDGLGPVRIQVDRPAAGRTDALFDQLDRDKDGLLTGFEMGTVVGALRRLDLDDDEMITAEELEAFRDPIGSLSVAGLALGRTRTTDGDSILERSPDESSLRLSRLLLRRYDTARGDIPGPPDSELSPDEFAIDPAAFDEADGDGDGSLRLEELRRFLDRTPIDVVLDVAFSADIPDRPTIRAGADGTLTEGVGARSLGERDVEVDVGHVRLTLHLDDGEGAADAARRAAMDRFSAADTNEDGYLGPEEQAGGPVFSETFAGLFDLMDRDGDGNLCPEELNAFADRQVDAARGRLVISASDQGRAIFAIVDQDRDLRLGAREVMGTVDRVTSWDGDFDDRVSAGEIPYHFRITLARGRLAGLGGASVPGAARPADGRPEPGPRWFHLMDRNDDGDVSGREFLGTREQFDRLDRDADGLIDPMEAVAPARATNSVTTGPG